jgi:hypothetical protein
MKTTRLQDRKGDTKGFEAEECSEKPTEFEPAVSNAIAHQRVPVSKSLKVSVVFTAISLCVLITIVVLGIMKWRGNANVLQKEMGDIRTEVADLRRLIQQNTLENLIHLKILVLNPTVPNNTAREIAAAVQKYAQIYHRDPDLILSIMRVESNFDPEAISKMGAVGLMQIMPHWVDILGIQCDLTDPDCNTKYGLQILGAYQHLYGSLDMALTVYNRGAGPVDSALMRGRDPDNGYAGEVRAVYDRLYGMNEEY